MRRDAENHGAVLLSPGPDGHPIVVVIMGVSGTGKTVVGSAIAARTGWPFAEGDDFHPEANKAKMASGQPLTDEDRWPWLRDIAGWIGEHPDGAIVACSALRRTYRDLLREGHPHLRFIHLVAPDAELDSRLRARTDHYMPASLLHSQLDTLEPLEPDELGEVFDESGAGVDDLADRAVARITEWMQPTGRQANP